MACHYGAQNKGEPCSSQRAGDVPLPLFTPQLITILVKALQTARRQSSHVCLLGCVCVVRVRERRSSEGVCETKRERLTVTYLRVCTLQMEALHETLRTSRGSSYTSLHLQLCCNTHGFTETSPCVKMSQPKGFVMDEQPLTDTKQTDEVE